MSDQEIIDLADKAGITFVTQSGVASATVEWLQKFASLVAAREREMLSTRQWQGLTADEIWQCNITPPGSYVGYHICMAHQNVLDFAEAIEAKLKEKNNA